MRVVAEYANRRGPQLLVELVRADLLADDPGDGWRQIDVLAAQRHIGDQALPVREWDRPDAGATFVDRLGGHDSIRSA